MTLSVLTNIQDSEFLGKGEGKVLKNLKKPTFLQKKRLAKAGIDPTRVFVKEEKDDYLIVLNRDDNKFYKAFGKHFEELGESI